MIKITLLPLNIINKLSIEHNIPQEVLEDKFTIIPALLNHLYNGNNLTLISLKDNKLYDVPDEFIRNIYFDE